MPEDRGECKCNQASAASAGFEEQEECLGMDARGKKRVSQVQPSKAKRLGNQTQAAPGRSGGVWHPVGSTFSFCLSSIRCAGLVWCPKCTELVVACCITHHLEVFGNTFLGNLQCPRSVMENIPDPPWHGEAEVLLGCYRACPYDNAVCNPSTSQRYDLCHNL